MRERALNGGNVEALHYYHCAKDIWRSKGAKELEHIFTNTIHMTAC